MRQESVSRNELFEEKEGSMKLEKLNLDINELRSLILEALKNKHETQYLTICSHVAALSVQKYNLKPDSRIISLDETTYYLHQDDEDLIRELIWNLIIERVLTIGINSSNAEWPFLKVTAYGEKVLNSNEPIPHDPSGYILRVTKKIPSIDNIIIRYLTESIETYNINMLLSSTIALGCASEKAMLLLIETFSDSIDKEDERIKFKKKIENTFIKTKFEAFKTEYTLKKSNFPKNLNEGFETTFIGIFELIRANRNDAGHPNGKEFTKEHLYANLQVIIPYLEKIYEMLKYFKETKI
ncbi:hypothetical protein [Leptospira sp. GIMC2001]|uniref:hypothetical protein n=1 Tax=Leptospira sp. GIMC2001 TaxID=1513297 RepID=UPI00234BE248|nr:hypothetical protein [Leptospira sp. GIMC2001]WCL51059.1 hypothetical protein O4O04_09665 [Leptospira sp. GIMC2001]